MPKAVHRQHKSRGHLTVAAEEKNSRIVSSIMGGAPGEFAKVVKNLGSYFELLYYDEVNHSTVTIMGSPCGTYGSRGKVRLSILPGDIVVVTGIESLQQARQRGKTLIVEISGKFAKKEAQKLFKQKRIHSSLCTFDNKKVDEEGGFIFEDGEDEELDDSDESEEEAPISNRKETGRGLVKTVKLIKEEIATIEYAELEVAKELGLLQEKKRRTKSYKPTTTISSSKPTLATTVEEPVYNKDVEIEKALIKLGQKAWDAEDDSDIDIDAI